jgi:hypothetical protein
MVSKFFLLFLLNLFIFNCFAQVSKSVVESNSDIIAKSIYIYRNTLNDTSRKNRENAIKDLKENIATLDTIITVQINEYLKINKAILKALDSSDIKKFDTLGYLHSSLTSNLDILFEKQNALSNKNSNTLETSISTISVVNDDFVSLQGLIINNSSDSVDIFIKILNSNNKEVSASVYSLVPYEFLDLGKIKSIFNTKKYSIYTILKFKSNDKFYSFKFNKENILTNKESSKFIIKIIPSSSSNVSTLMDNQTMKYFTK